MKKKSPLKKLIDWLRKKDSGGRPTIALDEKRFNEIVINACEYWKANP